MFDVAREPKESLIPVEFWYTRLRVTIALPFVEPLKTSFGNDPVKATVLVESVLAPYRHLPVEETV
jgi:hypothetical protein